MRSAILLRIAARVGRRGLAPGALGLVRGVERELDVGGLERAISQTGLPVIGLILSKFLPSTGATHLPPMKLS